MIDTVILYILILVWLTLTLIQGHRNGKANTSAPIISQSFQSIWMEFGTVLRFVDVVNVILNLLSIWYVRERTVLKFFFFFFFYPNTGLHSDVYRLISVKLDMIIEIFKLYIFILVWMTLTFIESHSLRIQKLWCPFSRKFKYRFGWKSVCCHKLFVEVHTKFILQFHSREELCWLIL